MIFRKESSVNITSSVEVVLVTDEFEEVVPAWLKRTQFAVGDF